MNVPLLDVQAQTDDCKTELVQALMAVVDSGRFIMGPEVHQLEERIAERTGARFAVGCASGTDALLLALRAAGVGPGDEVITTPFTFFATAGAIANVGAVPVFVDICPDTFNIDPSKITQAITARTRCIIPVHLFGQCADMGPIREIAEKYRLTIIEDAAQSLGARYNDTPAGSLGTMACFSFYPSKNLGGIGDGGMVTTNDEELATTLRLLRNHGSPVKYMHDIVGTNSRLDTLQAAALLVKLDRLTEYETNRRAHAEKYTRAFADCPELTVPIVHPSCYHVFNQYTLRVPDRDAFKQYLTDKNIGSDVYYPVCLHRQKCFKELGYTDADLPVSQQAAAEVISIPVYPELSEEQQQYVIATICARYAE